MIFKTSQAEGLGYLASHPVKFLCIVTSLRETAEQIGRYMYGVTVISEASYFDERCLFFIAIVQADRAQAICDRLASGLIGASIHDTWEAANERIAELI